MAIHMPQHMYPHVPTQHHWDYCHWPNRVLIETAGGNFGDLQSRTNGNLSCVTDDNRRFEVLLDVSHLDPDTITIKIVDKVIEVRGKLDERMKDNGNGNREFTRRYSIPDGVDPQTIIAHHSSSGFLVMGASKQDAKYRPMGIRVVPVEHDAQCNNPNK